MKQVINGMAHNALAFIKVSGSATPEAIARYVKTQVDSVNMTRFIQQTLSQMEDEDLVLTENSVCTLTAAGLKMLEELELKKALKAADDKLTKVQSHLFVPSRDSYTGAELKHFSVREDAFDYLKCSSVINGKHQDYHIKLNK